MTDDTRFRIALPEVPEPRESLLPMVMQAATLPVPATKPHAGRPFLVSTAHLALAVLWCVLHDWVVQRTVWRVICTQRLSCFSPVQVTDQAIYDRLDEHGAATLKSLFMQMSIWLKSWLSPYQNWKLAPFASSIYALDESTLDKVHRWIQLRRGKKGSELLAGRLSGLFDVRRQLWARVDVLPEVSNSLMNAREMISQVTKGSLLLFDLGYYSFAWFDDLTRAGLWWISRLRSNSSYTIQHVYVQSDHYLEALVWLGAYRADRAASLARLVSFRYRGQWYRYLTNVLDPRTLTGSQIAELYARRWDIEMAFRALKDYLGLNLLWSAKWQVIAAQIWACAILAQLYHALQIKLAAEAQVAVFDVSLALLITYTSRHLLSGGGAWDVDHVVAELLRVGRHIAIIRPSLRKLIVVPEVPWHQFLWPPEDLETLRPPRYGHQSTNRVKRTRKKAAS